MNLEELVSRIEFRNAPFPIRLRVDHHDGFGKRLVVVLEVKERETGQPHQVEHTLSWFDEDPLFPHLSTQAYQLHHIRRLVSAAIIHEVEETLLFDGGRIFDPHRERPTKGIDP